MRQPKPTKNAREVSEGCPQKTLEGHVTTPTAHRYHAPEVRYPKYNGVIDAISPMSKKTTTAIAWTNFRAVQQWSQNTNRENVYLKGF